MKKKQVLVSLMLMLMGVGIARADNPLKAYAYVQQHGRVVADVGCADFDISSEEATLEFDADGNAVMTIGDNTVAKLPVTKGDGGELCADFTSVARKVTKSVEKDYPYATIYSPFQLVVPDDKNVEVYAPTYSQRSLQLNESTRLAPGTVLRPGTGLIMKKVGDGEACFTTFAFSAEEATRKASGAAITSVLKGSALAVSNPTKRGAVRGETVYTLGHKTLKTHASEFSFFEYKGNNLNPGIAFLKIATVPGVSGTTGIQLDQVR